MIMKLGLRRLTLTVHLVASVGWIGASLTYVGLGLAAVTSHDPALVRATWTAMDIAGWFVIVPMALLALSSGVVLAMGTGWGLVRHYWVLISLGLTMFAAGVTVLHMPAVSDQAADVRRATDAEIAGGFGGDLFHSGLGVFVLLVIASLNVYKPRGTTRFGLRKQSTRQLARSGGR